MTSVRNGILSSAMVVLPVFLLCNLFVYAQSESCATPNSKKGECIDINNCAVLNDIQNKIPLTSEDAKFLRRSQCGFEGTTAKVCCPKSNENLSFQLPRRPITFLQNRFGEDENASSAKCGIQYSADRIFEGTVTDIGEFPWMALLAYKSGDTVGLACGGVLIDRKHILTAAHCVTGPGVEAVGKLVAVRLGEYDVQSLKDCDADYVEEQCAPPPVDVYVESVHPHPDYKAGVADRHHDIALIRLVTPVNYTNYVRPICLPTEEFRNTLTKSGTPLVICGWGKTEKQESGSAIKLKAKVPLVPKNECKTPYEGRGIQLGDTQICAGGGRRDSCKGDSGGPLMAEDRTDPTETRWYVVGVISFGAQPCAKPGIPAVHTETTPYLNWMRSVIKS